MKKTLSLSWIPILILSLIACSVGTVQSKDATLATPAASESGKQSNIVVAAEATPTAVPSPISVEYDRNDLDASTSGSDVSYIKLQGDSIVLEGSGATVNGSIVTITSAGRYSISGTLDDGQIRVDTEDEEAVVLILNGAQIACSMSAPIYVLNAGKTVITLADGTENSVTDGDSYILEDVESDEPNAAIFSQDDLTVNGSGSLMVRANYNNGIASRDELKIVGGNIIVDAVNDGLKGRDLVAVKGGTIAVNAGGDGMRSDNDEDAAKGHIIIEGGTLDITAGLDGIQAETRLVVSGGSVTLSSGGGSANSSSKDNWGNWGEGNTATDTDSAASAKGLKAAIEITITGGTIQIDSSDDAIHSNDRITIGGGEILIASGDDGIHADSTLGISGGTVNITQSYEGIESAVITIADGNIHLVASDDGINVAGGNDGSSINGRPGQNPFAASSSQYLAIHGGYIAIDAVGDGLDINGSIEMTQGVVLVSGPTSDMNGALDYDGTFTMTGGFLVAAGSAGMAQAPSPSSTQYSVMHTFASAQAAGTLVHIETEDGDEILTFAPAKAYRSLVLSSPELKNGSTYVVYTGGRSTGTVTDGLYTGGTYAAGAEVARFTISSIVTGAGAPGGGFPGGPGGMRPGGGGRR